MKLNGITEQKGSVYLEFLLSFLVCLIIFSSTLPAFLKITLDRKELLAEAEAEYFLSREVIKYVFGDGRETFYKGKYADYTVIYGEDSNFQNELCIYYEIRKNKEKSICRKITQ